jgi:hypothetical protein
MHFPGESTRNICCNENWHGNFEELHETPEFLRELLTHHDFRNSIRYYNSSLQISTIGSTLGKKAFNVQTDFPFCIRVHGNTYHSIPPVIPQQNQVPRFAQLYVIDNALEELTRSRKALDYKTTETVLNYLTANNPWAINSNSKSQSSIFVKRT